MSGTRRFPAAFIFVPLFGAVGLAVTAACLAGAAQLMETQGFSGTAAAPLATAAVGAGSLLSAFAAAFRQRQRGLLVGLLQGALLAGILAAVAMFSGTAQEPLLLTRMAVMLLCGAVGGFLGAAVRGRRHPLR